MVKKAAIILGIIAIVVAVWLCFSIAPLLQSGLKYDKLVKEANALPKCMADDKAYVDFLDKHGFRGPNSLGEYVSPEYEKFEVVSITLNRITITIEDENGMRCMKMGNYYGFKWSLFGGL